MCSSIKTMSRKYSDTKICKLVRCAWGRERVPSLRKLFEECRTGQQEKESAKVTLENQYSECHAIALKKLSEMSDLELDLLIEFRRQSASNLSAIAASTQCLLEVQMYQQEKQQRILHRAVNL